MLAVVTDVALGTGKTNWEQDLMLSGQKLQNDKDCKWSNTLSRWSSLSFFWSQTTFVQAFLRKISRTRTTDRSLVFLQQLLRLFLSKGVGVRLKGEGGGGGGKGRKNAPNTCTFPPPPHLSLTPPSPRRFAKPKWRPNTKFSTCSPKALALQASNFQDFYSNSFTGQVQFNIQGIYMNKTRTQFDSIFNVFILWQRSKTEKKILICS